MQVLGGVTSSDKKAFKVDKKGYVKAKKGSATLTSEKYGTINVSVINPKMSSKKESLQVGGNTQLSLSGVPDGLPISWISSDQNVVQVYNGKCVAVGIGKAIVTAYVSGKGCKCKINVKDKENSTLLYNVGTEGKPVKIKGLKRKLTFDVSDNSVTIEKNTIKISSSQKTPVSGNVSDGHKLLIYLNDTKPVSDSFSLKIGETAYVFSDNCHEFPDFKSKNSAIATVNERGVIIGYAPGSTKISTKLRGKKINLSVTVADEIYTGPKLEKRNIVVIDPINGNPSEETNPEKPNTPSENEIPNTTSENEIPDNPSENKIPIITHIASFDSKGGTKVESQEVEDGEKVEIPEEPTKNKSIFNGWMEQEFVYDFDTKVYSDISLNANWLNDSDGDGIADDIINGEDKVMLVLNLNSGVLHGKQSQTLVKFINKGKEDLTGYKPELEGHTFLGWYYPDGKEYSINDEIITDTILTAYYKNNESGEVINTSHKYVIFNDLMGYVISKEIKEDGTVDVPNVTRFGYILKGWQYSDETYYKEGDTFDDNTILTAAWNYSSDKKDGKVYVRFRPENGNDQFTNIIDYNSNVDIPSTPEYEGYVFDGWYLGNTKYDFSKPVTGNITLIAHWKELKYTVSFNGNGAEGEKTPIEVRYSTLINVNADGFTRIGYGFLGYSKDKDAIVPEYTNGSNVSGLTTEDNGKITLYAIWKAGMSNYTVKHLLMDIDGEGYTEKETETLLGETGSNVTPKVRNYEGFTSPAEKEITISGNGNTLLEYKYKRNMYNVTLSCNGSIKEVLGDGEYYYGEPVSVIAVPKDTVYDTEFTGTASDKYRYKGKTDYYFSEWSDKTKTDKNTFNMPSHDVTLTASGIDKYTKTEEQYYLDIGAGDYISSVSDVNGWYDKGSVVSISAIPFTNEIAEDYITEDGYRYKGGTNYSFDKWSDGSKSLNRDIVMNTNRELIAIGKSIPAKTSEQYLLTVSKNEFIDTVVPAEGSHWIDEGETVTVSATYGDDYVVSGIGTYLMDRKRSVNVNASLLTINIKWNNNLYEKTVSEDYLNPSVNSIKDSLERGYDDGTHKGWKAIKYTDTDGNIRYANPYEAGNINPKPGTVIYIVTVSDTPNSDGNYEIEEKQIDVASSSGEITISKDNDESGHKTVTISNNQTETTTEPETQIPVYVPYKVVHRLQKLDLSGFVEDKEYTFYSQAYRTVTPATLTYEGFTTPEKHSSVVSKDGTTEIIYDYIRNSYDVNTTIEGIGINHVAGDGKYLYGETVTLKAVSENIVIDDYTYDMAHGYRYKHRHDYSVDKWSDDTGVVGNKQSYTFKMGSVSKNLIVTGKDTVSKVSEEYRLATLKGTGVKYVTTTPEPKDHSVWYDKNTMVEIGAVYEDHWKAVSDNGTGTYKMDKEREIMVTAIPETYTVSYESNGATSLAGLPEQSFRWGYNETVILSEPGHSMYKQGYKFEEWNTKKDGSGISYNPGDIYNNPSDVVLYAQWIPVDYTISFDMNGGEGNAPVSINNIHYGASNTNIPINKAITKASEDNNNQASAIAHDGTIVKRSGYTFRGWSKSSDGNDGLYGIDYILTGLEDPEIKLYAIWDKVNYNIDWQLSGGSVTRTVPTVYNIGSNFSLPGNGEIQKFIIDGRKVYMYEFMGWEVKDKNGNDAVDTAGNKITDIGGIYNAVSENKIYGNLKCTALWSTGGTDISSRSEVNVYVDFGIESADYVSKAFEARQSEVVNPMYDVLDSNISSIPAEYDFSYAGTKGEVDTRELKRKGYSLIRWTANGGSIGSELVDGKKIYYLDIDESDVVLHARWRANNYTVTFDTNGGDTLPVSDRTKTVTYDSVYGNIPTPTRTGHTFMGWYTEATGGNQVTGDTIVTEDNDHILYAHWKVNSYSVSLGYDNGTIKSVSGGGDYNYGQPVTITAVLKDNYTESNYTTESTYRYKKTHTYSFSKWGSANTSLLADKNTITYTFTMPAGNVTLTASGKDTIGKSGDQYYLTVTKGTNMKSVTGAGWYNKGASATASGTAKATYTDSGSTYTVDSSNSGHRYYTKHTYTVNSKSFTMNSAQSYTVTATETKSNGGGDQYYLTVTKGTNMKSVTGAGWYNKGATATASGTANDNYTESSFTSGGTGYQYKKTHTYKVNTQKPVMNSAQTVTITATDTTGKANEQYYLTITKGTGVSSVSPASQWVNKGGSANITATASTGYTISGGTGSTGAINAAKTVNVTATANTYKITYNGNGATGGSTAETSFTYGNTASVRSNGFTRTNYSFTGWNTKADGSGTPYAAGASYTAAANLTLYAQWKLEGYTLKWTGSLSQYGHFLGTGNISGSSGNAGYKRIVYINTSGQTAYADPYSAGSITIKAGTAVTLQMVAGRRSSDISWFVGGTVVPYINQGIDFFVLSSTWAPSGSYTLSEYLDHEDRGGYCWWSVRVTDEAS